MPPWSRSPPLSVDQISLGNPRVFTRSHTLTNDDGLEGRTQDASPAARIHGSIRKTKLVVAREAVSNSGIGGRQSDCHAKHDSQKGNSEEERGPH